MRTVASDNFRFVENMSLHRMHDISLCSAFCEIKHGIECIRAEKVSMLSVGWPWTSVDGFTASSLSCNAARLLAFCNLGNLRRYVEYHPMVPHQNTGLRRNVRVLHDKNKALCMQRDIEYLQRRTYVGEVPPVFFRNFSHVGKRRAFNTHMRRV